MAAWENVIVIIQNVIIIIQIYQSFFHHNYLLKLTVTTLEQGLSVASPMVDVEHDAHDLNVNILFLAPEIATKSNFCVVEHLTPLKFNLSGTCFAGPVRQTNLALITWTNLKQIVTVDSLD